MMIPTANISVYAGIDYNPPANLPITKFLTDFMNQFESQYVSNNEVFSALLKQKIDYQGPLYSYFDPDNPAHMRDLQSDPAIGMLKSKLPDKQDTDPLENGDDYYYRDVLGSFKLTDGNGNQIVLKTIDDYRRVKKEFDDNKITFPITIYLHLVKSTDSDDGVGTYNPASLDTPGVTPEMTEKTFTIDRSEFDVTEDQTSPNVMVGTKLNSLSSTDDKNTLNVTDRYSKTNGDGSRSPVYGHSLFTGDAAGRAAAIAYAEKSDFNTDSTVNGNVSSDAFNSDEQILKAGKYYQTVTYKLENDTDDAIKAMLSGSKDESTNQNVEPYDLYINGNSTKATEGTDYAYNKNTGTITVLRPITVSDIIHPSIENPTVSVGEKTDTAVLTDTTKDTLENDAEQVIPTSEIKFDDTYYTDKAAKTVAEGLIDSDGKFTQTGTYYRKITFTLASGDTSNISDNGGALTASGNQLTYIQAVNVQNPAKSTIADATAMVGDTTSVPSATTGNDITDISGKSSLLDKTKGEYNGVSFGTNYYDVDPTDPNKQAILKTLDGEPTTLAPVTVVNNNKFIKAGTYLRTITFYLTKEEIANNSFDTVDPNVKVNTEESTVTYVQQIKINATGINPVIAPLTVSLGTKTDDDKLSNTTGDKIIDGETSILDTTKGTKGIEFGKTYYDDPSLVTATTEGIKNGRFIKSGSCYRTIKFYLTDDAWNKYSFPGSYGEPNANEKSVTYIQSVTVNPAGTSTLENKDLTVFAGTKTDGKDINGTALTDLSSYILKDDTDNTKSLNTEANVSIVDYYASDTDAKAGTNPITITSFEPSQTYFRTIKIKVADGDGYTYTYPGAISVDKDNDIVTYLQQVTVNAIPATVKVGLISAHTGESTADTDKDTSADTIDNSTGSILGDEGITFDNTNFYSSAEGALKQDKDTIVPGVVVNDTYAQNGTFYRRITFNLKDGVVAQNTYNNVNGVGYTIDGNNITFVQMVNISQSTVNAKINNATASAGTADVKNSTGNTVEDNYNSSVITDDDPTVDGKFYDSIADIKANKESVSVVNGVLTQSGDSRYYRTITFKLKDGASQAYTFNGDANFISKTDDTVTYAQAIDVSRNKATATYNGTISGVTVDSTTNNSVLTDKTNDTLTDDVTKDSLIDVSKGITLGTNYYNNASDALNSVQGKTPATSDNVSNNKFNKAGSYFRTITFNMNKGDSYGHVFAGSEHYIDYANDTITYVQTVKVGQEASIVGISKKDTFTGVPIDSLNDTTNDYTLVGENTGSLVPNSAGNITFGDQYYTDPTKALSETTGEPGVVKNGVFIKNGTYYRKITFNLIPDATINDSFNDPLTEKQPQLNGITSATYLQMIVVAQNVATATLTSTTVDADTNIADVPDKHDSTLIDANNHSILQTNDGKSVNSDNSKYYDKDGNVSPYIINGKFTKAGTYYRKITFKIIPGTGLADEFNGGDVVDKTDDSVTYLQPVVVKAVDASASIIGIKDIAAGTSVDATSLKDAKGSSITNTHGSIVQTNGISFGNVFYDQASDVISGGTESTGVKDGKLAVGDKTYYHAINFKLTPNALEGNKLAGTAGKDYELTTNTDGTVTVTYAQEVRVNRNNATPSIDGTISVNAGTTITDDKANESNDIQVDGKTIVQTNGVQLGEEYYKTSDANNTPESILGSTITTTPKTTAGVTQDGVYVKTGIYYRKVTFKLAAGTLDSNALPDTPIYSVSDDKQTVTYLQTVTINPVSVMAKAEAITVTSGTSTSDPKVTSIDGDTLTVDGNDIKPSVSADSKTFYKTAKGALDKEANDIATDVNGKFVNSRTYYRVVTFTPTPGTIGEYVTSDPNTKVNIADGTVTYAQAVTVDKSTATASIAGTTSTITVSSGSSVKSEQSSEKNDVTGIGTDGNSDSLVAGDVQFGTDYYSTDTNSMDTVLNGTPTATDGVVSGGSYIKSGTYYRKITVPLKEGAVDSNNFDSKTAKLSDDGKSVTYVQTIKIETITATVNATNPISAKAGESSTSLPAVDGYTLDVNGEAIKSEVSTDNKIYKTFNGKALSDEVADGKFPSAGKYYREISFTPTDASEYTFADPNVISNENGVVTYVQTINVSANAAKVMTGKAEANVGDPITKLPSADGYTLNNDDTDSKVIPSTPTAGTTIYKNFDATTKQFNDPVTGFDSVGTYYREITFKAADADQYSFADPNVISNKDGVITYAQPISVGQESGAKVSQAVTDTKSVKVNISGEDSALSSKDGYSLTDASGKKTLIDAPTDADGISFSPEYYTLENGVLKPVSYADAHDYTISKRGRYYRKVIFKVSADTIANYDFSAIKGTPDSTNNTISFIQEIDASTNPAKVNISSPSVSYNTSADSSSLKDPAGVSLKDGNDAKDINSGDPIFSGIFSSKDAARNATSDTGDVTGNLQAGTYYQRVTFPLADNDGSAYDFGDGVVSNNGKSVTYVRTITVKPQTHSTGGSSSNNTGTGDDDEWTYYKDPGVVTTKTDQPSYSLNNRANNTVKNRALGENTDWITDQYRTNREGVKQYRVATGEWIDSHDVYFAETSETNTDNDDEWTYYKNPGVVTTKTAHQYYGMNHKDDSTVENRALGENTDWITDQYRTNREGVKQYRVATNEWIDSHDVYFAETPETNTDNDDEWTYYKNPGVVTTKTDHQYYGMNHKDDSTVENRALEENTDWITDQYRTNREGVKQYRVATNEWVDSHDVVFTSTVETPELTNIRSIKGIVNVDATDAYYSLYNIEDKLVTNRALSEKTSWATDKVAQDAEGNTYYRVATNEWVKLEKGVYYSDSAWY